MPRTWFAIVALAVVSLLGDFLCRSQANSVDRDKLLEAAGKRVHQLPTSFGRWRMSKSQPLTDDILNMLHCRDHEQRVYVDEQTGETVTVILLTGGAGPLLAHTPEICYSSVEFETLEPAHPVTIRGTDAEGDIYNEVTFRSLKVSAERLRVLYAWRKPQGNWLAPHNPRLALGGQPLLYKLQVAAEAPLEAKSREKAPDPARRFLLDLLPFLETSLNIP
jgi:Protein of unknown function (DUF3485)